MFWNVFPMFLQCTTYHGFWSLNVLKIVLTEKDCNVNIAHERLYQECGYCQFRKKTTSKKLLLALTLCMLELVMVNVQKLLDLNFFSFHFTLLGMGSKSSPVILFSKIPIAVRVKK